jgi:hypothetical protein
LGARFTHHRMQPKKPADFLIVLAYGLATVVVGLLFWLGPLAYGVVLLAGGGEVVGWVVTTLGAGWAVLLARDMALPGMLAGAVHSVLIFGGVVKDPWEGER